MSEHAQVQTVQAPVPQQQQPANAFQLQRKCACGSYGGGGECDKCRHDGRKVQRVAVDTSTPTGVPSIVNDVLGSSGQSLDAGTRAFMEPRFGHDFSNVRVHTDARAAQSAQAVNALAYTVGRNVVFGTGQYAPGTERGSQLLAHELTHVVQQTGTGFDTRQNAKPISDPSDPAEVEADHAAGRILAGEPFVTVRQSPNATIHALSDEEAGWAIAGGAVAAIGAGFIIAGLLGAFDSNQSQVGTSDLSQLLRRLEPACQGSATNEQRQAAVDALVAWARRQSSLQIDWSRIDWFRYDTAVGATGSKTDAEDPNHIKVTLGPDAFSSASNLYSTFRHELVHVQEHQTRPRSEIESRGIGVQEIYAYLWELEHQNETGLARRENWGLQPDGTADRTKGLARVVDGVFRALISLTDDLSANPSAVPRAEQLQIARRVACAMIRTPREVVQAVLPEAPLDQWQRECAEGVEAPQRKLSADASLPFEALGVSSPESPAEREADRIADGVAQGWTTASINESIPQISLHRSATGLGGFGAIPTDEGMPLPVPAREFFETGFGRSFDDVRIHTDAPAARSAQSFQADAFTVGRDIYFDAGKFDPESTGGRHLIAHELTHTIQQQGGAQSIMRQAASGPTAAAEPPANPPPIQNLQFGSQPQATFDASLDRKECQLTLTKKIRFDFLNDPPVNSWGMGYGPWPQGEAEKFQQNFIRAVTDRWSFKYVLVPTSPCAAETCKEFKAAVRVVPVNSGEHTTMQVGFSTGEFPPVEMGVSAGGDRARLHSKELEERKTRDERAESFTQIPAEHEFGHMLGLPHVNATHCGPNAKNPKCYGETPEQMENIMGRGSEISEADYEPFAYALGQFNSCSWKAQKKGLSGWAIFGIVAGAVAVAGLAAVGIAAAAGAFK